MSQLSRLRLSELKAHLTYGQDRSIGPCAYSDPKLSLSTRPSWATWVHVGDLEPVGEHWCAEGLRPPALHCRRKTEAGGDPWELMASLGSSFWDWTPMTMLL